MNERRYITGSKAHMTHTHTHQDRRDKHRIRQKKRQTSNHAKVKLDKLQCKIHYSSSLDESTDERSFFMPQP